MSLKLFLKDIKTMSSLRQGPFGLHLDAFAQRLCDQGYSYAVGGLHIRLIDNFGRWLKLKRVSVKEISSKHVERYVRCRRRRRQPNGCDASALKHFIKFLQEKGVIAEERAARPQTSLELVTEEFVHYLLQERALSPATGQNYREFVQDFLRDRFGTRIVNFTSLCAADILRFVQSRADGYSRRARIMPTALRSFFRYLQYKGLIETDLASAVPSVAQWSMASVPKALSSSQIELLIASRKGTAALERRDYATFLLLARLGLRAGEVVALTLDDIDWQEGCITVRGKGGSCTKMPLPADIGEAIADYLLDGRPTSKLRHVFLSAKAPVTHLTPSGLSTRVEDALDAAGIDAPNHGSHLFRHSLATNMLRNGASLAEIGELLRHRSTQTTEIYAKVDFDSLGQLALPWPGGAK